MINFSIDEYIEDIKDNDRAIADLCCHIATTLKWRNNPNKLAFVKLCEAIASLLGLEVDVDEVTKWHKKPKLKRATIIYQICCPNCGELQHIPLDFNLNIKDVCDESRTECVYCGKPFLYGWYSIPIFPYDKKDN